MILLVGFVDDTRSLGPRVKLLGQALAVLILYLGGIRIHSIEVLNLNLDLGFPAIRFGLAGLPGRPGPAEPAGHPVLVPGLHEHLEPHRRHGWAGVRAWACS